MHDNELQPEEIADLTARVVTGVERLDERAARRRRIATGAIAVALVAGVASVGIGLPLMLKTPVAAPGPTPTATRFTPTPTSTPTVEPTVFERERTADDELPVGVIEAAALAGTFDADSSRLVGTDDDLRYFLTRGLDPMAPYCLILVSIPNDPEWVAGCGSLRGTTVTGAAVGKARLGMPGTMAAGWIAIDPFVSMDPTARPAPAPTPTSTTPPPVAPQPPAYTVADVQAALNAIGPDVPRIDNQVDAEANAARGAQTEALAADAANRLGRPVALIRPTYVGFPDESTGSPNSLLWWVVTSEPTELAGWYTHQVNGMPWGGWGQGDRDKSVLQARVAQYLAEKQPGRAWAVITYGG